MLPQEFFLTFHDVASDDLYEKIAQKLNYVVLVYALFDIIMVIRIPPHRLAENC